MPHSNSERLLEYWRERKGAARLPEACAVDPIPLAGLLPQLFLADRLEAGDFRLRLVGEIVRRAVPDARKGASLIPLWRPADRAAIARALSAALRGALPVVIVCEARGQAGLEIAFAPLAVAGRAERLLGLVQPLGPQIFLPSLLCLRGIAYPAGAPPPLRLAAIDGRLIA